MSYINRVWLYIPFWTYPHRLTFVLSPGAHTSNSFTPWLFFLCDHLHLTCVSGGCQLTKLVVLKLATCPPCNQAVSFDISQVYHNSPITHIHKKYLCVFWKGGVYVQHVEIEGLATAGSIQGNVVDTTITLLKVHKVEPSIKWVNNFIYSIPPILLAWSPSWPPHSVSTYQPSLELWDL